MELSIHQILPDSCQILDMCWKNLVSQRHPLKRAIPSMADSPNLHVQSQGSWSMTILSVWNQSHMHLWELMKGREFLFGGFFILFHRASLNFLSWKGPPGILKSKSGVSDPNGIQSLGVTSTLLQPMELISYLHGNIKEEGLQWCWKDKHYTTELHCFLEKLLLTGCMDAEEAEW